MFWEKLVNDVLSSTFGTVSDQLRHVADGSSYPLLNIYEKEGEYSVKCIMPGVDPKEVNITFTNGIITIEGEKKEDAFEKYNAIRIERTYGKFSKTIRVTKDIDGSSIKAAFKDGVLELKMKPLPEAAPRKITIS